MRDFKVIIIAYGYRTSFIVKAEDSAQSIENAIVDKLGENSVKWDESGFYDKRRKYITYEEVIDANTSERPLYTEEGSRSGVGAGAS